MTRIADDLGGRRVPLGAIDRNGADVVTPLFHVSSETRKRIPQCLWAWLNPVAASASDVGKVGLLVLRQPGMRKAESLVVIKFSDFVSLCGALTPPERGASDE